jgi:hypothetical protein
VALLLVQKRSNSSASESEVEILEER